MSAIGGKADIPLTCRNPLGSQRLILQGRSVALTEGSLARYRSGNRSRQLKPRDSKELTHMCSK